MRFRYVAVLTLLTVGLPVAADAQNSGTVFLVRHAEKVSMARDAILSPQGVISEPTVGPIPWAMRASR